MIADRETHHRLAILRGLKMKISLVFRCLDLGSCNWYYGELPLTVIANRNRDLCTVIFAPESCVATEQMVFVRQAVFSVQNDFQIRGFQYNRVYRLISRGQLSRFWPTHL